MTRHSQDDRMTARRVRFVRASFVCIALLWLLHESRAANALERSSGRSGTAVVLAELRASNLAAPVALSNARHLLFKRSIANDGAGRYDGMGSSARVAESAGDAAALVRAEIRSPRAPPR
jgi:hypothetical protein